MGRNLSIRSGFYPYLIPDGILNQIFKGLIVFIIIKTINLATE